MRRFLLTTLLSALTAPPLVAQLEHARLDFPFVINGQEQILTYDGTHDVRQDADPRAKLVVLVHHGADQNPTTYFARLIAALDVADRERAQLELKATTLVLAPAMIGEKQVADRPERYAGAHYPVWDGGWREGADSLSEPPLSNFDLLDGLVRHVVDFYPQIKAVVHVGHSAGGQLVNRYAFGTPVYDELRARRIVVRYVVANASSLLYFDRQRPDLAAGEGFVRHPGRVPSADDGECLDFNRYKYGLDELVPYMTRRPLAALLAGFRERELVLFQGLADNDPQHDSLDRNCGAMLQGRSRLERGERYHEYLGHFFGPEIYATKLIAFAPGVGHDSSEMFRSQPGRALIFIDADGAAAALATHQQQPPGGAQR